MNLICRHNCLSLNQPVVMGILNVTPDSFFDGGRYNSLEAAAAHGLELYQHGAEIIDVGGESTRPGAESVSIKNELCRVIPVIEYLSCNTNCIISVDTSQPEVMRQAIAAGASIVNDVRALQAPSALQVIADTKAAIFLTHMQGQPNYMQSAPKYKILLKDIADFLQQRVQACLNAGIKKNHIAIDPGFGFGKTIEHNYQLLNQLNYFSSLQLPIVVGLSRKSMLSKLLGGLASDQLIGSVVTAALAVERGASIIRAHDVKETIEALKIVQATKQFNNIQLAH